MNLFTKIQLLHSGRTAYAGSAKGAIQSFADAGHHVPELTNPADFFMDILTADGAVLCELWHTNHIEEPPTELQAQPELPARWVTSFWWQLRVLFQRHNAQTRGDVFTMTNSFVVLLVALVAVLLWFQCDNIGDKKGLLFFILIQQGFNALQGVLRIFPSERALVVRERSAGSYHVGAYFLAKTSADIANSFTLPTLFATAIFFGCGFQRDFGIERFMCFMAIFLMTILSAQSMGLLMSCLIDDLAAVQIVTPTVLLSMMLAGGFYVNADNIPVFMIWLKYTSFQYWGYSGLMANEFAGRTVDCSEANSPGEYGAACPIEGDHILDESGLGDADVATSLCVLAIMAVAFRVIAYVFLRFKTKAW